MTLNPDGHISFLRGDNAEPALLVRRLSGTGEPVLYVHGATFPSALSVAYRFDGGSWMDDLVGQGFDAWAFDFAGFGGSDRYSAMSAADDGPPVGRAPAAAVQIARVVAHIAEVTGSPRVSLVAHSWGTMAAGLYAAAHPERIGRLCLFGPVAQRDAVAPGPAPRGSFHLVSVAQQLARFGKDVPRGHPPVLIEPELARWGPDYLATDRDSGMRSPPAVKVPSGPVADVHAAWSGKLAWRPEEIRCPTLVVRGEWDSTSADADAQWLLSRIRHPIRRDVKVAKGTHLMHLEHAREGLFAAVNSFLTDKHS